MLVWIQNTHFFIVLLALLPGVLLLALPFFFLALMFLWSRKIFWARFPLLVATGLLLKKTNLLGLKHMLNKHIDLGSRNLFLYNEKRRWCSCSYTIKSIWFINGKSLLMLAIYGENDFIKARLLQKYWWSYSKT